MSTVQLDAMGRSAKIGRVLGAYGSGGGPTVVITAGIHGNEPAGVFAFLDVLARLQELSLPMRGRLIGLAGNLQALEKNVRYLDTDLNRLWRRELVDRLMEGPGLDPGRLSGEERELVELYTEIRRLQKSESGRFYFVDLHTTSSQSPPFIPFDDTLTNREFVEKFPVPGILGIEEHLPGTLLSYLTRYDSVAIGYEGGQHHQPSSIDFHRAMLWMTLVHAGCLSADQFPEVEAQAALLRGGAESLSGFFEVRFRYAIQPDERFRMRPGFRSFQKVLRNQALAENDGGVIAAPYSGRIFMPLYQAQGADGFFLIRPVARFWLELSKWMRRWRCERILSWLPGVQLEDDEAETLVVNTRVARFLATEIFHLLGYRRQVQEGTVIRFSKREPT